MDLGHGAADDELTDAWRRLLPLFLSRRDSFFAAIKDLGLTPPHGFALMELANAPTRMRDLAGKMHCDASYVTAVVDRLEELGLAERRVEPDDRRVREVALTAKGRKLTTQLRTVMSRPPAVLEALTATDRAALARILRKLDAGVSEPWEALRPAR